MNKVKVVDTYNFNELRDKIFYSNTFGPKNICLRVGNIICISDGN